MPVGRSTQEGVGTARPSVEASRASPPTARMWLACRSAPVIEIILSRGVVVDAYVRVSLLGIELITLDAVWSWSASIPTSASPRLRTSSTSTRRDEVIERATDTVEQVASRVAGAITPGHD